MLHIIYLVGSTPQKSIFTGKLREKEYQPMKKFLIYSAVFAFTFFGCSDESNFTSPDTSESKNYHLVKVDKENHIITKSIKAHTTGYCVLFKGSFNWDEFFYDTNPEEDTTRYEIRGDTLAVYYYGWSDPLYYIGGSTDSIYGEWNNIECSYIKEWNCISDEDRKFKEQYYKTVLTISESKFKEERVYMPAYFTYDDYMNTQFITDLYVHLEGDANFIGFTTLYTLFIPERESDIKEYERSHEIEVLESSKLAKTFKLNGKTIKFEVTKIERDSLDYTAAFQVSSGDKECTLEENQVTITKENCSDLSSEGLLGYDKDRDFNDSLHLNGLVTMTKDVNEFRKCITELAATGNDE